MAGHGGFREEAIRLGASCYQGTWEIKGRCTQETIVKMVTAIRPVTGRIANRVMQRKLGALMPRWLTVWWPAVIVVHIHGTDLCRVAMNTLRGQSVTAS